AWAPLKTITNTTAGLMRSGQITFDPPSNWKTASLNGDTPQFYFVRYRTISPGGAPAALALLGRGYVNAPGATHAVIPPFDYRADLNHDGYLDNAEYAHRRAGMDARLVYETRYFNQYGQMRPFTNPSNAAFRSWVVDFHVRFLKAHPLADGLFVDNSGGRAPVDDGVVRESRADYSSDYGSMLSAIGKGIAPRWVLANTSGGQTDADGVIRQNTGYYEEFALRPLASNYQQFEFVAALIAHRQSLKNPAPYAVLDALPTGGSPTDPRTQPATPAHYHPLAHPHTTLRDVFCRC